MEEKSLEQIKQELGEIDFKKLITRIWVILWLILAILLVMKFCFGIWYPIAVNNNNFIAICNFIDNNTILKCLVGGMFYILNINVWYLSSTRQKKYSKGIYFAVINIMANSTTFSAGYNPFYGPVPPLTPNI